MSEVFNEVFGGQGSGGSGVQAKIKAPFVPINQPITDGQTIQQAFESTQGQINAIISSTVEYVIPAPSSTFTITHGKVAKPSNVLYSATGDLNSYNQVLHWQSINGDTQVFIEFVSSVSGRFLIYF